MGDDQKKFSKLVLAERDKGNVVFLALDEIISMPVKDIVKQPVDGLLWDLNRDEATALSFMDEEGMIHWVNNFAVALVIRELKSQIDRLEKELADYKKHFEPQMIHIRLRGQAESEQSKTYTTHAERRQANDNLCK